MGQEQGNIPTPPAGKESRICKIQFRAAPTPEDSDRVEMYAAVFGKVSEDLGDFVEVIQPGAFAEALADSDIRALINHDPNRVLARSASGTLEVKEDETGLWCGFTMPGTTFSNDMKISMARGDVNQCSFAFDVAEDGDAWEYLNPKGSKLPGWVRTISKIEKVYDVSIVTYPAYPDTTAALRSRPKNIPGEKKEIPPPAAEADGWEEYMQACSV